MPTNHKPSKNLKDILANLHSRAYEHQGEPIRIRLSNNLRIDFRILGGIAVLLISRSSVFPSPVEWTTIMRHWPYPTGCNNPQQLVRGTQDVNLYHIRHYLRGEWLLQRELLQTDGPQSQPVNIDSG